MLDGVELQQLEEVAASAGYRLITQRVRDIREAKLRELRSKDLNDRDTQAVRGYLDALDRVLEIPAALKEETRR